MKGKERREKKYIQAMRCTVDSSSKSSKILRRRKMKE